MAPFRLYDCMPVLSTELTDSVKRYNCSVKIHAMVDYIQSPFEARPDIHPDVVISHMENQLQRLQQLNATCLTRKQCKELYVILMEFRSLFYGRSTQICYCVEGVCDSFSFSTQKCNFQDVMDQVRVLEDRLHELKL